MTAHPLPVSHVATHQLDELAAETAAYMCSQHPDFGSLAARIAVSNLVPCALAWRGGVSSAI